MGGNLEYNTRLLPVMCRYIHVYIVVKHDDYTRNKPCIYYNMNELLVDFSPKCQLLVFLMVWGGGGFINCLTVGLSKRSKTVEYFEGGKVIVVVVAIVLLTDVTVPTVLRGQV